MKELQPLNDNVLIKVSEEKGEKKTASGIIIPDSAKQKENVGEVLALGSIENPGVAVGDKVLYKEYSGKEVEIGNEKFVILPYADLLAKVIETEAI